jgi:DNA-binding transcriptional LysR family regulator
VSLRIIVSADNFTIAFVPGVTLTKWTTAWQERHPGVPLAFEPSSDASQLEALRAGDAHVAFVRLPVDSDGLNVVPLYEETPVVVVPKDHPASVVESVTLAELEGEDRVSADLGAADAVELVAAGGGIVVVPQSIARLHARKDVVARPVTDAEPTRIAIAWVDGEADPLIDEFVGIVRGRTANSSRGEPTPPTPPPVKPKRPLPPQRPGFNAGNLRSRGNPAPRKGGRGGTNGRSGNR